MEGFEWEETKAEANAVKHGVTFEEAATVFDDPQALTDEDELHSEDEQRYKTVGMSSLWRVLVVIHTDRGDYIRIISARDATSRERRQYEQGSTF